MSEDKQHIGIVICGHVDAGKNTGKPKVENPEFVLQINTNDRR